MKLKFTVILAGILSLAIVAAPLTARACGDKNQTNSESDLPEGTETSWILEENSISSRQVA